MNGCFRIGAVVLMLAWITACSTQPDPVSRAVLYSLGGTLTGLTGELQLSLNGKAVSFTREGDRFELSTRLLDGQTYQLVIKQQPDAQLCQLEQGQGEIRGAAVDSIRIECISEFSLSGTIEGLRSGSALRLALNGVESGPLTGPSLLFKQQPIAAGRQYQLSIAQQPQQQLCSVEQGSGELSRAEVSGVVVVCRGWGEKVEMSHFTGCYFRLCLPQVSINASGEALAVLSRLPDDGSTMTVFAHSYLPERDNGWEPLPPLPTSPLVTELDNGRRREPVVALNASGQAVVAWRDAPFTDNPGDIMATRLTDPEDRQPEVRQLDQRTDTAGQQRVAISDNGTALVVWVQRGDDGIDQLWARRFDHAAGDWEANAIALADTTSGRVSQPRVVMDGADRALALWRQPSGLWSSRYRNGDWEAPLQLAAVTELAAAEAQLAYRNGQAMALWVRPSQPATEGEGALPPQLVSRRFNLASSSAWSAVALVPAKGFDTPETPQLALDGAGRALAVFRQEGNIWATEYRPGADRWQTAEQLNHSSQPLSHSDYPRIALNDNGQALAVWRLRNNDVTETLLMGSLYADEGGGWQQPFLLADDLYGNPFVFHFPIQPQTSLAFSNSGEAVLVWEIHDEGEGVPYALSFR